MHGTDDGDLALQLLLNLSQRAGDDAECHAGVVCGADGCESTHPVNLPFRRVLLELCCSGVIEHLGLRQIPLAADLCVRGVVMLEQGWYQPRVAKDVAVIEEPEVCNAAEGLYLVHRVRDYRLAAGVCAAVWRAPEPSPRPASWLRGATAERSHASQ